MKPSRFRARIATRRWSPPAIASNPDSTRSPDQFRGGFMRASFSRKIGRTALAALTFALCHPALAQSASTAHYFHFFFPSGAVFTAPGAIDSAGQVTGYYTDSSNIFHGFLRQGGGKLVTIDPPGTISTVARGSTQDGTVSGYYQDASNNYHGFVRDTAGNYTSFDATTSTTITVPLAMNALGQIVGFYVDTVNIPHGFLRN